MPPILVTKDYITGANRLACSPDVLMTVNKVEAPRGGFLPDGSLTILYERHIFHRYTKGKYSLTPNLDISNPKPGGYVGGASEWGRWNRAAKLNQWAAEMSASYGKFQIMGFNHTNAGYSSAQAMIEDFKLGEHRQLEGFINFIFSLDLDDELQRVSNEQDEAKRMVIWAQFARIYNGKGYAKNQYDLKLEKAYKAVKKQKLFS